MFVVVFVLALALSVYAQYGQPVSLQLRFARKLHFQTPAPPPSCPQGMTMTQAYGTTCYNGGFYYNGVCCAVAVSCFMREPRKLHFQTPAPPPSCPQGMTMAPAYGTACYNGGFYYNGVCCEIPVSCFKR